MYKACDPQAVKYGDTILDLFNNKCASPGCISALDRLKTTVHDAKKVLRNTTALVLEATFINGLNHKMVESMRTILRTCLGQLAPDHESNRGVEESDIQKSILAAARLRLAETEKKDT